MMKIYLAPLRGFTDVIFRNTYCEHFSGVDMALGPFIPPPSGRKIHISHLADVLPDDNKKMALIPQILSNSAEDFVHLARRLQDYGYHTLNWNLGCPFNIIAKKKRGSGLLPFPDEIRQFLDDVIPRINVQLSIKARLGRASSEDIFSLIPIFNEYPLSDITIHPRTGVQLYEGNVNLDAFGQCLELSRHPLIYNGDIVSLDTFLNLKNRFRTVRQWMIGRGIISDPFLPEVLKSGKDDIQNKWRRFESFHNHLVDRYRSVIREPFHLVDKMKGFWRYFSRSFDNRISLFRNIQQLRDIDSYDSYMREMFRIETMWKAFR